MTESRPPKQNGVVKTALTAVVASIFISALGAITTVKVIQSEVRHIDEKIEDAQSAVSSHAHADIGTRVGKIEGRVTRLETITEERRRFEEKQWKTIQADVRDIKNEIRQLRQIRQRQ